MPPKGKEPAKEPTRRQPRRAAREVSEQQAPPPAKRHRLGETTASLGEAERRGSLMSSLSTPPAPNWGKLSQKARSRIDRYNGILGKKDDKLQKCLYAFIDFLPPDGRESIARDILNCPDDEDEKLFDVFENLSTALLYPSEFSRAFFYT